MSEEIIAKFCPGCGYPIILNMLGKVLSELGLNHKAAMGLDIGCSLLAWNFLPAINTFQTHHGRVSPILVGFKRAKPDSVCVGLTGDGGAYSIGLQSLIYAARRDEPIMVLVVNNAVYAMTGGQTAPTTLLGQVTDTDPTGSVSSPWQGPELLSGLVNKEAFLARTSVDNIKEVQEFIKKAIIAQQNGHFALVEILSLCPTNWKTWGPETIKYLQNLKKFFKLGEISHP